MSDGEVRSGFNELQQRAWLALGCIGMLVWFGLFIASATHTLPVELTLEELGLFLAVVSVLLGIDLLPSMLESVLGNLGGGRR